MQIAIQRRQLLFKAVLIITQVFKLVEAQKGKNSIIMFKNN